jgi:hypothetical protein
VRPPQLRLFSWPLAALIVVGVVALAVTPLAALVILGACVIAALIGPAYTLQALAIATLVAYASPAIVKLPPSSGVLLRVVMIAAILRVLPLLRASDLKLVWPVWLLGLLSALTSMQTSPALAISIMKVITFTLAATVVLVAFGRLHGERLVRLQSWFLTVGFSVIVLSGLTLLKPGLGIGGDGGLQGLLDQPQALGIFIAPFAAWSVAGVLLMRRSVSRLEVWLALGTLVLVALTKARTGAFALAFAVGVVMLSRFLARRRAEQASLGRPMLIVAVATVVLASAALATGAVSKFATQFAYKGTEKEQHSLGGAFHESRGAGIVTEWNNFLHSPLLGNGFGVYPDGKFPAGVVEFMGIPISAPIEKGFLPTAILEEGGLIGAASLTLVIAWLWRSAWRATDLRWRALFVACVAVNVGECVFLSPGGIGLMNWLLIGLAVSAHRSTALPQARRAAARDYRPPAPRTPDSRALPVSTS